MKAYREFCEMVGVSPLWYGVACVVGALATIVAILIQKVAGYESYWFWFIPLAGAAVGIAQHSVGRTDPPKERARKKFRAGLVAMCLSLFPGVLIATVVEEWLF